MNQRRTIFDLPHFQVIATRKGESVDGSAAPFEMSGVFDRLHGVKKGRAWLLLPGRKALVGDLIKLAFEERTATFAAWELPEVDLTDMSLPFLDGYWQAYHVWMVVESDWVWTRILFQAQDAIADRRRGEDGKEYLLRRRAAKDESIEDLPTYQSPQAVVSKGVVKGGWDHEHCELCWSKILPEHFGYRDQSDHWVCESCYSAFVSTHDLSFLNDYWPPTLTL